MTCLPEVWVLLFLSLRGIFPQVLMERLSLEEGQNLDLHCVNRKGNTSALEWKDPGGFTIFFNALQATRDGRYQLLHYSNDSLSIRLSNVTRHDEGLFTCLYYSENIGTKVVNATVWAPPSKPLLETLRNTTNHTEENIILRCSTEGSWPAPQITWLLQNGMEIFGNSQHQLEAKRFHSVSNLAIYAFPRGAVISCVIHHKALGRRNFTLTLHLEHAKSDPTFNLTEGNPTTQTTFPSTDTELWANNQTNMTYRGFVEEQDIILFPGLVSLLLLAFFIIVLLFVVKLWKAHRDWKKENNNGSEQPIESYRPKANETPGRLQKNICVIPWRNSEKYIIQESYPRTPKPSEGSQDSSVFEKELSQFKETDM